MDKKRYSLKKVGRETSLLLLNKYHYLHQQGFSFRSGYNYGLFFDNILVGIIVFTSPSVPEIMVSAFGKNRNEQSNIYELSRLCLNPHYYEKNLTSFFVARAISLFRKMVQVDAILSYADAKYHIGYIYQATNFRYFGLTAPKKDFYFNDGNGNEKKHQRGKVKGSLGEWKERSQKHKYLLVFRKKMPVFWEQKPYPKGNSQPLNYHINKVENFSFIPKEVSQYSLF